MTAHHPANQAMSRYQDGENGLSDVPEDDVVKSLEEAVLVFASQAELATQPLFDEAFGRVLTVATQLEQAGYAENMLAKQLLPLRDIFSSSSLARRLQTWPRGYPVTSKRSRGSCKRATSRQPAPWRTWWSSGCS